MKEQVEATMNAGSMLFNTANFLVGTVTYRMKLQQENVE